ncbi:MAG: hypothetical protein IKL49_11995 [Lachnospiraceae bacterium]|nr:hypothetical protein [Lachnospiraceae bacterium]
MGRFKDEDNILVLNQSDNVLVNYNFMLRVEGIYDLPCKSVHSFTKENEFEYVQEGGLNDYVHMLRKPVSKPFSFTVERYVGMDIVPPLPLGAELVLPVILMVAPNANQFDKAKRTFVFTGCTVMSKTYGELNAEKSDLLTETIVIGYREMTEVTVPVHMGSDGKLWEFDGTKVQGNGKRSANINGTQTGTPKARRWLVKEGQEGKSVQSAKKYTDIFSQETNVEEAEGENNTNEDGQTPIIQPIPRVKKGPNTGVPVVRRWPKESSAKKLPVVEKTESSEEEEEKLPPRVKPGPNTGKVKGRRWKPDVSAKPSVDTGEAQSRKWPPTQSAKKK